MTGFKEFKREEVSDAALSLGWIGGFGGDYSTGTRGSTNYTVVGQRVYIFPRENAEKFLDNTAIDGATVENFGEANIGEKSRVQKMINNATEQYSVIFVKRNVYEVITVIGSGSDKLELAKELAAKASGRIL